MFRCKKVLKTANDLCKGAAKVQASICNFSNESQRKQIFWYTILIYSTGVILVTLRIVGKILSQRLSMDDWIVVIGILLTGVPCACILKSESSEQWHYARTEDANLGSVASRVW